MTSAVFMATLSELTPKAHGLHALCVPLPVVDISDLDPPNLLLLLLLLISSPKPGGRGRSLLHLSGPRARPCILKFFTLCHI